MKNILVPVGSTESAITNLKYAINLASLTGATVYLINLYKEFSKVGRLTKVNELIVEESEEQLELVLKEVNTKGVDVISKSLKGDPFEGIQRISAQLNIDLIKAKELQTNYFHKYNTSLNGLMIHHDIPPREFLDYVHDIDIENIKPNSKLNNALNKLQGKKYIYTNGSKDHSIRVLKKLNIYDQFKNIFDIELDKRENKKSILKSISAIIKTSLKSR